MKNSERSVSELRNIGETRRKAFSRLGIYTVGDVLNHYPRAYQNRGAVLSIAEVKERLAAGDDGPFPIIATVMAEPVVHNIRRGMTLIKLGVFDETGSCSVTFFNQKFVKSQLHCGASFRFWGRFRLSRSRLELTSPIFEPYVEGAKPLPPFCPVYPLTSGLTQKIVYQAVTEAMALVLPETEDPLPRGILEKYSLPTRAFALRNIHFPESEDDLNSAKRRLIFDELFTASVALAATGGRRRTVSQAVMFDTDTSPFTASLPYRLTGAQERSLSEIVADMASPYAMNRMLTGDVGSGKTAVAAAAAFVSLKNGYDCLFMVPTEILAVQHYNDISRFFERCGIGCVYLLTGSTQTAVRREIISALASDDEPTLVIGTHALLSDDIKPSSLGLVIIDEQHRFGAMQRATLADKSCGINTLVMSATPIPRTLSLIMFGSLDISRIDELPAGRQPIDTFVVNDSYRVRLQAFIRRQVSEGHQIYIVCPAIEETRKERAPESLEEAYDIALFDTPEEDAIPLKNVSDYSEELRAALPECRVAVVHGKMRSSEREAIMGEFCRGEVDIIVSTTVIEVGVNVPNATLMIVENAERFGLSQLHQLRGRVGRGTAKSYFILVSDARGDRAARRLSTIKHSSDGYAIAEADLKLRGPGDIFAENGVLRQHGESSLALASHCTDTGLITDAFEAAQSVITSDPTLTAPEHAGIHIACEDFIKRSSTSLN